MELSSPQARDWRALGKALAVTRDDLASVLYSHDGYPRPRNWTVARSRMDSHGELSPSWQ